MKINIQKSEQVHIDNNQMQEIAFAYLEKRYKINRHMWIEDGKLIHDVEYIGSHKWYDKEEVREASKLDKYVLKILKDEG